MQLLAFERQVESFVEAYQKAPLKSLRATIALGVSGGADSVAMLLTCHALKLKHPHLKFMVLHFNHGSRPLENAKEQKFVSELSDRFEFQFITKNNPSTIHNETEWRKQRQHFFKDCKEQYHLSQIWLAHHLDDSLEWSLMQQAKSGNFKSTLGIPVKNGSLFRPFLGVTKDQILYYLKTKKQDFMIDSSNDDINFERNWWRHHILTPLKSRYPMLLKHYAHRAYDAALKLNLIYLQTKPAEYIKLSQQTHLFYLPKERKIIHSKNLLKKSLHSLSSKDRMKISTQLRSLFHAFENRKKGPIYFSGGVKAYLKKEMVILTNVPNFSNDILNDSSLQKILKAHNIIP